MAVPAELARIRRDLESLSEEIAVSTGPRAKAPLTSADKRKLKAEIQSLIQQLDELAQRLG
jgi:hypothetical protein